MYSKKLIFFVFIFSLIISDKAKSQSFGFGCLGFVGGYGGYSYQAYDPKGLNSYVDNFNSYNKDSLSSPMGKFGQAKGYRVGINFFRANIKGFILTTKGFYQYLIEKKSATINSDGGSSTIIYELDLKNWGVGIDLGTTISGALSWKVIDAAVLFNTVTFTDTRNIPGPTTLVKRYNNENTILGYTFGTGFILAIVDQYISIEGVAGYTIFSIDRMKADDGSEMPLSENSSQPMRNFIASGGFNAVIQLNVGFPL
ncbi:MAG: hypothetical protein M1480_09805 [Bacteroidetes bacterium]|nr:hypothetical protein [Bacteroidota bacterium]